MAIPLAPELGMDINASEIYSDLWSTIPPAISEKIDFMLNLGIWVLVAGIAYFVILFVIKIMSFIFNLRKDRNLKKISENLEIANKRLEEITGLLSKKKGKEEIEKEGKRKKQK